MLTHIGTQTIKTERLILRRFTHEDARAMFDTWANDERVTKFLTWEPHGTLEVTQNIVDSWIKEYEKDDYYHWAIELEGKIIGSISVVRYDENSEFAEIGYCSGFDFWGNGYMTEAAGAVIDFLFKEVNVNRVTIEHATKNPGSGKVAQKCGLTLEGVKREYFKSSWGEFLDIAVYSILKREWTSKK